MKGYEVDVGGDDYSTIGGGALQGGINTGSVNSAAVAEESHNLLAFGTSLGTVEFWDPRSKSRAGILSLPQENTFEGGPSEVTALQFQRSGLTLATGSSTGLIHLYDLRSPLPLLKKDQGYGYPIKNLIWLESSSQTRAQTAESKILSADKRIIKIWDPLDGTPWTSVEPAVDLNHVEWCKDSGMLLTANEGKQQHAFFVPQLGPAPKWCAFLDNLVEEMAEDPNDPASFAKSRKAGEVYDNYKFLTPPQLRQLNIDHLIGKTGLLRPYMHGFFVSQKLYEEALLINNPEIWQEQRAKSIKEKIDKERESRIRGKKKVQVKVNRKLAEKMLEREEKNERRKAKRILARGGDDEEMVDVPPEVVEEVEQKKERETVLTDPRFSRIFEDPAFEIDEHSYEFRSLNPSTVVSGQPETKAQKFSKGLTAAELEDVEDKKHDSSSEDESSSEEDGDEGFDKRQFRNPGEEKAKHGTSSKPVFHKKPAHGPTLVVSSSSAKPSQTGRKDKSFGTRAAGLKERKKDVKVERGGVGEKSVSFVPEKKEKRRPQRAEEEEGGESGGRKTGWKDRRSASGNKMLGR
jgi:ribosome biogenesis protein ENP2